MKRFALFVLITLGLAVVAISLRSPKIQPQIEHKPIGPVVQHTPESLLPVWDEKYQTAIAEEYDSSDGAPVDEEKELEGVQCPIPMKDRVKNYTGIQCVFASLECLGRWAECKQLLEPEPLTSRPGCKSYSGPSDAAAKLKKYGVKFEHSYNDRPAGIRLIKKAMAEGRGTLWGVPGHAMVLCHYDEEKDVVKWIDNSDRSLRIQTTTVAKFNQRWDGWVIVIYADPDVVPQKAMRINLPNQIPIIDRNGPQGKYPRDYIPVPKK